MLNSLVIKNFRMLEDFTVEKLGRVNLIVGKNNSGKSTVLEALRIYAGNANQMLLGDIARTHNEKWYYFKEQDALNCSFPFECFFSGRMFPEESDIQIELGELNNKNLLTIKKSLNFDDRPALAITKNNKEFLLNFDRAKYSMPKDFVMTSCSFVPTQFISVEELEKEWNTINLTDNEEIVTQALQIISPTFRRLAFDGQPKYDRWVKVKLADFPLPVPLKSLGDGMIRILQLALKLVSAQGGFLLIDEFENGLHYSVQEDVWKLLFEMAKKLDVQVFATTHSWDCIESFAKVALEKSETEGVIFRMGKSVRKSNQGQVIATIFSGEELKYITQSNMEIR